MTIDTVPDRPIRRCFANFDQDDRKPGMIGAGRGGTGAFLDIAHPEVARAFRQAIGTPAPH